MPIYLNGAEIEMGAIPLIKMYEYVLRQNEKFEMTKLLTVIQKHHYLHLQMIFKKINNTFF